MIKSMTGFAAVTREDDRATIAVTIRALNHRYLDLQLRVPQTFAALESDIRNLVARRIARGRVELSVSVQIRQAPGIEVEFNEEFGSALSAALQQARERGLITGPLAPGDLLRLPQALTIRDRLGRLDDLHVTILGDILHSRVARSNIHLLSKFGAAITLCGPAMWLPREFEDLAANVRRVTRIEDALDGADAIIVLRVQTERIHEPAIAAEEYILGYQLTSDRLRLAKPEAIVLHPGPMIRGLEIDPSVADGPQSCVLEQVTNGLAVRMALLYHLVGGAPTDAPHPAGSDAVSKSSSSSSSNSSAGVAKGNANAAG